MIDGSMCVCVCVCRIAFVGRMPHFTDLSDDYDIDRYRSVIPLIRHMQ